ncbi:MAG: ribonuclease P protein component [Pseudomonadota bacterium]
MTDKSIAPTGLKRRSEFLFVRGGLSQRRKTIVIQAREQRDSDGIRVGFTATKKVGNAVIRNRAKRRMRAAASELLTQFGVSGCDYVFISRAQTPHVEWQSLLDDIESALITLRQRLAADPGLPPKD